MEEHIRANAEMVVQPYDRTLAQVFITVEAT